MSSCLCLFLSLSLLPLSPTSVSLSFVNADSGKVKWFWWQPFSPSTGPNSALTHTLHKFIISAWSVIKLPHYLLILPKYTQTCKPSRHPLWETVPRGCAFERPWTSWNNITARDYFPSRNKTHPNRPTFATVPPGMMSQWHCNITPLRRYPHQVSFDLCSTLDS